MCATAGRYDAPSAHVRHAGETTVPNAPKPDTWTEVVDKKTGLLYYWNRRNGETTALGEPKPGPYGRASAPELPGEDGGGSSGFMLGEDGGSGRRSGSGGGSSDRGPSLMKLVANPLVVGVTVVALAAVGYELLFK